MTTIIDAEEKELRKKFLDSLTSMGDRRSAEAYIRDRFVAEFSGPVGMFSFVNSSPSVMTVELHISSARDVPPTEAQRRWPARDVELFIKIGNEPEIRVTLFRSGRCGTAPCHPANLADNAHFKRIFTDLIKLWPTGMFKSITIHSSAKYEHGQVTIRHQRLSDFGQIPGAPTALFEILYNTSTQRHIALCVDADTLGVIGKDQGANSNRDRVPSCNVTLPRNVPTGTNGRITLVRAFTR